MPFSNPIIGGNDTLIRDKIQSENFVSGVSGWRIERNGSAEFNEVISRGDLIVGPEASQHITISTDNIGNRPEVEFFSGSPDEVTPARIFSSGPADLELALSIRSALHANAPIGSILPEVTLTSWSGVPSTMNLWADEIRASAPIQLLGENIWSDITLTGTWVSVGASTAQYLKDGAGTVWIRGIISSGANGNIATLPVGYRPVSQAWQSQALRSGVGTAVSHVNITGAGAMTVATNLVTAQTQLSLYMCFPTW